MPLLHSFIAIAAGFACMALLTAVTTLLTRWLVPSWSKLAALALGAALQPGGKLPLRGDGRTASTARIAPISPLIHSLILAIIVLLVSTIAASELRGQALGFYPLALAVLPSLATLGAGILTVLYR